MSKVLKWLDNYWYHYKWPTIIVSFFLIMGIVLTTQFITKVHYDLYIMYVGDASIPDMQYHDIINSLSSVSEDYNRDGEIRINFSRTAYISDEEHEMASSVNSVAMQFLSSLTVQPYYIYLMPISVYDLYKDTGVFVPISDLAPNVAEDMLYDACAVYFNRTEFANKKAGMSGLGEQTVLVVKNIPYVTGKAAREEEQRTFENHADMFCKILNYQTNN